MRTSPATIFSPSITESFRDKANEAIFSFKIEIWNWCLQNTIVKNCEFHMMKLSYNSTKYASILRQLHSHRPANRLFCTERGNFSKANVLYKKQLVLKCTFASECLQLHLIWTYSKKGSHLCTLSDYRKHKFHKYLYIYIGNIYIYLFPAANL